MQSRRYFILLLSCLADCHDAVHFVINDHVAFVNAHAGLGKDLYGLSSHGTVDTNLCGAVGFVAGTALVGTDALADQSLTDTHRSYFTDLETIDFGPKYTWYEDPHNDVKWVGKSLDLQSRVAAKFIVDVSEYRQPISALVLYVSYENSKGETIITALRNPEVYDSSKNYYAFTFDGLNAADLRTELTLTMCMYEDMVVAVDVLYSMASYGNGKTGTLLTLCQALLAYSDCAKAYFD